ncbi:hypothetical protein PFISCL1PPCAC_10316 [Pristionchus fissidentatus]|uniref:Uncharacterized protein n=1 Tax=Pristionchus fissidentatus TaxID=1538716 RepID=A0AAV5VKU1_9BILA|nr:hypothetical protein PFISCL1PPCAC_10316 [Pristionchus fissidentatus]
MLSIDLLLFPRGRRRRRGMGWSPLLSLLAILSCWTVGGVEAKKRIKMSAFSFTAPLYNYSFIENGRSVAKCDAVVRPGVPLLAECKNVEFRVIGGDTDGNGVSSKDRFESSPHRIGNFVFLKIEQRKGQQPLNRELKSHYSILVRAHCTKQDSSKLETITNVSIRVVDVNDQSPLPELDLVEVTVDGQSPPFTLLTCIDASDADAGINGEVVYSLAERNQEYTIEPLTGCVRTVRSPLRHNSTTLKVRIEDRASRLFYYDEKTRVEATTMEVKITVTDRRRDRLSVLVEKRPVDTSEEKREEMQMAAVIRVEEEKGETERGEREPKYEVVILDEHGKGGLFDVRRETTNSWTILTRPGMRIPDKPKVTIRAGSDSSHDRNTTAEITVETVEMHNITFDKPRYDVYVREDTAIGRPIGVIEATTVRREDQRALKYRIEKTEEGDLPFSIDEESGRIRITNWLDYEMKAEYSFNVMVKLTGYGHQSMTSVTVHVEDANDHSPTFSVKLTRMSSIVIPKDAKQGFQLVNVSTVDRDSGLIGRVQYRLVALPPSKGEPPFRIDNEYGNITLGRLPANETSWMVGVIASDRGVPPRSAQLRLAFHKNGTKPLKLPDSRLIVNQNENAPVLMNEEEPFEVDEDVEIGEIIGRIPARDDDSSFAGSLRFATLDHHIDIDDNGTITVARPLSELLPPGKEEVLHPFMVTVYDRGNPVKSAERQYAVRVRDVNDRAPVFDKPWYRIQVPENTPVGTVMLSVSATDEDGGENGRVRYELAGWNTVAADGSLITVDEKSGEITLNGALDREEAESHRFTIISFDGGSPSRVSFANLTILVDDVNDNQPRCAHQVMRVSISEDWPDGALVGCLAVHDEDSGSNGRLSYGMEMEKMEGGEPYPFRVDRHSGCVFVKSKHPLDYEKRKGYNLSVEVSDNGETPLMTICQMEVNLIDINENRHPPAFQDTVLEASVYENEKIGALVISLIVTDADGNGNVTLDIVGGDGRAAFTVVGGDVHTAQVLDRERKSEYWITVRATDNTPVPLSSHVFVYIRVLDRSDHLPIFKEPFYAAEVAENAAPDTVVVKVQAEDADWPPTGKAAKLSFAIISGDPQSFFNINPDTGYITTGGARKLDRETQRMHELDVRVSTQDEGQMNTGTVKVYVKVGDENDNPPVFLHSNKHEYEVPAGKKGRLARIVAIDADEGANAELHFSLKTLVPGFSIDNDGYIETDKELKDGQVSPLDVIVRDGGTPPLEATRRIVLNAVKMDGMEAENNHAPKLAQTETYKFDVSDTDEIGTPIGFLKATDEDGHRLWWSIVPEESSNYSSFFDMNPLTGHIMLVQPIDRLPQEINKIDLSVRVTDGKAEDEAKVVIQLARQPSLRPTFEKNHYEITLSEKTPIGSSILTPTVKVYGSRPLEYSISTYESARAKTTIGVDPSNGNVMLIGALDYEAERRFQLVLSAKQGSLMGFALLTVNVVDENDNPPVFTQLEYEVAVSSNTSTGTVVTTVTAFDSDEGENALIVYDIISGNELGFFSIDRESGEIRTTKAMEHSEHYESILTVRGADRGGEGGGLSSMTTVRVRTTEGRREDGVVVPRFERSLYHLSVRENTPVGSLLLAVRASSVDGHVRYETGKKCSWMEVHPVSGAIRLKRWLTKIRSKSINCTVIARGTGDGEASTKVVFRIVETNEHSPIFRQQIYRGSVRENATAGITVQSESGGPLVVSAIDKDSGTNALIGYRLLKDDPYFTVDLLSGTIRTRRSLDYEKLSEWRFHVVSHDMGHPPRYSSLPALVIVRVEDVNDVSPSFSSPSIDVDLVLPSVAGVRLATLRTEDPDTKGEIRYFVRGRETAGLFRVDQRSGDVLVMTGDRKNFTEKSYTLDVLATDGVHSASQEVRIRVKNASQSDLRFSQSVYIASLQESDAVPSPVPLVTVQASLTSDPSQEVHYTLLNTREDFTVVPSTGLISFIGESIDRETEDHVLLLVQARSSRSHLTSQCIVRVTIGDVNDNEPRFLSLPYHVAIPKNTTKGAKVVQVHAVDADYGVNGTVTYSSDDISSLLELNVKSGKITLKSPLEKSDHVMEFTVKATDGGTPSLSSSTVVRVEVVDSARPRFMKKEWKGRVKRETKKGEEIVTVEGKSEAERARLVYRIDDGNEDGIFDIDADTGVISLRESMEGVEREAFDLTVTVVDAVRPAMRDRARVRVELDSSSSTFLSFTNSSYRVSISEETPTGTPLLTLSLNNHTEESLDYALSGPNSTAFRIDSSGLLSLASPLDFEQQRLFVFKATAQRSEEKGTTTAAVTTVVVEVLDGNDESPEFVSPFAFASVPDSARTGDFVTLMRVVDKDTVSSLPEGARLLYSVIDGDDTLFTVDKHTGVVRVGREMEEEDLVERTKMMNVSVSDGLQTAFGRLTINISISGHRTRSPRFEQSQYVVSMKESSMRSPSTTLTRVRAIGGVEPLHYSLGGGISASWPVGIDHSTGKIHLKTKIERRQSDYVIPLIASDSLGRRAFSTLTLRVIEENDHSPQFPLQEYSCSISSGAKAGESLLTVSAMDDDEGDSIEYALMGDNKGLSIDERSGLISVGSESRLSKLGGSTISLIVRATDGGNPPHSASTQLNLHVLSSDIPIPRFANSLYRFTVAEDAAVGFLVGRVQQTANEVGEIRYEMQPKSASLPFTVDRTGKIVVQALLDREKHSSFRFVMVAHAAGGAHSLTTVVISIDDVNDNAPLFRGNYEGMSVREDAPVGTSIGVFSATDDDVSSGGKITFSLLESASSSDVSMDSSSGWLSVASSLDRERKAEYSLTARITDQGGRNTDLPFTLKIDDVNDESPMFDEKNYTIRIDPSLIADSQTIGRVTVKDADLPPNNLTRLYIVSGNENALFSIDNTGRITVAERGTAGLMAAGPKSFDMEVLAHDGVHSRTAIVTIISAPSTSTTVECPTGNTVVRVKEDVEVGYRLDLTSPSLKKASYSIIPLSSDLPPLPFAIDENDGSVKTSQKLDREKIGQYSFTRRMTSADSGHSGIECEEKVRVEVDDVNDHAPVFEKELYEVGVKENEVASESERIFLVRVEARDEDRGAAGRIEYALMPHSDNAPFRLDGVTGVITLVETLDREKKEEYVLSVVATDGGEPPRRAKATVKVSVADQNDNAPEFERKEYATRIMESESVGYEILTVSAIGGDEGETIRYELVEGHAHNAFVQIGEKSGVLKLSSPVDFEKTRSLSVRVRATDSGTPPLSTETSVNIEIMDENDNEPRFEKEKYVVRMSEEEKEGTVVLKVSATDADSGHLGTVEYSIEEKTEGEEKKKGKKERKLPFEIGRETGEIRVKGKIDYEKTKEYEFEIRATDGGARHSSVRVRVEIDDENDNPPVFAECNLTAIAQKSVSPGHVLLTLSVSDADTEKHGGPPFKMEILGEGAEALSIDDRLNVITTSKLARIEMERLMLKVRATDKGGKSAECPLVVDVKEESTHPPKAKPLSIKLHTLYGEYQGGDIGWVEGTDEDTEDAVRYALVEESVRSPGNRPHQFRVEAEVGSLWAAPGIYAGIHTMNVSVTDGKFYAYAPVTIEVVSITESSVDHSMVVRVDSSVSEFYARHKKAFKQAVATILNIGVEQIRILSVVDVDEMEGRARNRRKARGTSRQKAIDVAFIAHRRSKSSGLMSPKQFYVRAATKGENGLKAPFSVQTELCGTKSCRGGECRDEVVFMEGDPKRYSIRDEEEIESTSSLVVPRFERRRTCKCPQGKGGVDCSEEVNGCARSTCTRHEMCIPQSSGVGARVECVCPPGTRGKECDQKEIGVTPTIHVDGHAFFEVDLPSSFDQSMDLSIELRTTTRDGYLMYAEGEHGDYHALQIKGGNMAYSWDSGRGETTVESTIEVADGDWHTVWVSRKGRAVEMRVDEGAKIMGEAPSGGEVVNLGRWSKVLVIGTKVRFNLSDPSIFDRSHGLSACIRTITVDDTPLVLTSNALRLFAAKLGCRELAISPCYGVNATAVCKNDGKCIPTTNGGHTCECSSSRFDGVDCSIDRDPCGLLSSSDASPCPVGITCIPLNGRAQCQCPLGHTGERCEKRVKDFVQRPSPCLPNPCGSGTCLDMTSQQSHIGNALYICRCGDSFKNTQCDDEVVSAFFSIYSKEIIVGLVAMLIIAAIAFFIYKFCRYRSDKKGTLIYDDHVYTPHGVNPNLGGVGGLPSTGHSTLIQPPPPLPPRTFRNGRPTIEVRPYAADERVSSSRGDSGESLNGSFGKLRKGNHRGSESRSSDHLDMSRSIEGDSSAMRDLEALRRIGLPLPDDHLRGGGKGGGRQENPPPLHRRMRGRDGVSRGEALMEERFPLGDDWEAARSTPMTRIDHAMRNEQERRQRQAAGGGGERGGMRVEMNGNGKIAVADTLLSPVENDPEYMTMRPRGVIGSKRGGIGSGESQKRPLLAAAEDDESSEGLDALISHRPPLPAHGDKRLTMDDETIDDSMWQSRVYDDPHYDSSQMYKKSEETSNLIGDIDGTDDEEAPPLPSEAPPLED